MAIRYLSGQTIDGTLTVSGNVQGATFNGFAINSTGTNNVANQIVRTESNGYVNFGWINSVSGNHTGSITRITASNDAYLRYVTPAQFRTGVTDGYYAPSSTVSGVTSVATGNGLTGGTIISTGTLSMSGSYTGNFSVTGNVEIAQTGGTQLKIVSGDASGSQDVIVDLVSAFDYRGRGILYRNSNDSNKWFSGVPYNGGGYSIGYDNSQPEYKANSKLFVASSGNVGIGTTSPGGPLHVKSNNTIVEIESSGNLQNSAIGFTTTTDARYEIGTNISGGTNFELYDRIAGTARISFMQGGTVGIGTLTPVAKLEVAGSLKVTAYTSSIGASPGVSLGYNSASNIALLETWGSKPLQTMTYGYQSFHTNGVERMRILGVIGSGATAGNVGIGTDAPQVNLHINEDTSNSYGKLRLEGSNRGGIIEMYNQTSYPVSSWTTDQSGNTFFATSGAFAATSLSTKFTILTAGNVGIGTTSPSSKLVVAGDTQILTSIIGASKNYATSQGWLPGAAGTFSSQTGYYGGDFSINGAASENSLIWGENGFGQRALQWQTIGEAASDADGGWNKGISGLPDGNTHAYMSYVYVKRTSTATTGTFYYGCATVLNLSGSANSNPYFHVHNIGSLPQDVWCVAIGIIQAHTDTNTGTPSIVGIYRVDTGVKILGGTSFRSISGVQTTQSHRTYHYYSTNPAATLAFANPGFYVIDGTEPNLSTLVNQ